MWIFKKKKTETETIIKTEKIKKTIKLYDDFMNNNLHEIILNEIELFYTDEKYNDLRNKYNFIEVMKKHNNVNNIEEYINYLRKCTTDIREDGIFNYIVNFTYYKNSKYTVIDQSYTFYLDINCNIEKYDISMSIGYKKQ